jgi:hypothetical protein
MTPALSRTLGDLKAFLEARRIPYAVIGGMAVSVRGEPRQTADIDLVAAIDVPQGLELLATLPGGPFEPLLEEAADLLAVAFVLPMRHRDTGVKVDLALALTGFEEAAITRATPVLLLGQSVPVITGEDLLLMKLLAGRPRDESDAAALVARSGHSLDWDFLRRTAAALSEATGQDVASRLAQSEATLRRQVKPGPNPA